MADITTMLTPPRLAKIWGVSPDKILKLINAAELRAVNLATNPKGRPRYRISLDEIARFEESRMVKPPVPKTRRRRRAVATAGKEYF